MTKRIFLLMFVALFLFLAGGQPCAAQSGTNPCLATTTWWFPLSMLPGWFYYSSYPGTYTYVIAAWLASCHNPPCDNCYCIPTHGGSAGSSASSGSDTPMCNKPINLATGNTDIRQQDLSVPGLGGGLQLSRTWNSTWPIMLAQYSAGMFGPLWRSTYEEAIVMPSDNHLRYLRGDGSVWVLGLGSQGFIVSSPATVAATLATSGSSWVLTFQGGESRRFDIATGHLTAIIDRNGNTTQLTYDSSNRLTTVTSPSSQHLYFNYPNGSSLLVSSVTSDFGTSLSYSYDAQGRLNQVTYPDQTTVSMTYNAQSLITQVTDSSGKVLESHTYDSSGRGLTGSQANGVNAVTVAYPQ